MSRPRFFAANRKHKQRTQKTLATRQRRLRMEMLEDRRVLAAFTWDGNSDGDGNGTSWNDPLNWTADAGFPNGTADTATFGNAGAGSVNVNGPFTVGALALNNTAGSYVFGGAAGNSLTIDDGAGGGSLSQAANVSTLFQVVGLIIPNPTAINIADGALLINSIGVPGTEISGAGSIVKSGSGGLFLAGGNTFLGGVTVNDAVLAVGNVAGSATGTGNVTVNNAALFAGNGAVAGGLIFTGTSYLAPGGGLGTGNLKIGAGQTYEATINGTTPDKQHDQLVVTGTVDVTGATLSLDGSFAPNPAVLQSIVIVSNDGTDAVTGTFAGLPEGAAIAGPGGGTLFITYRGGDGNDIVLDSQPIINGTPGNDTFAISGVGTTYTITINGVPTVLNNPPSLTINGLDGNDTLTVNYSGGAAGPAGGIAFHGGTGAADNDKLVVTGGTFASVAHTFTTTGPEMSGSIVYNNGGNLPAITYDGLEPIDMTGSTITDLVLNLPGTADLPILEDDGIAANGISQIRSAAGTFDTTTFSNTLTTLTINLGGDAAAMTVVALPDFTKSLTINGQAGADTVNFTGSANLAALTVTATGGITDGPAAALTVAGTATLTAGTGNIVLDSTANNFSTVSVGSGNVVTLRDASAINLGPMNVAVNLTVNAPGPITDTGPLLIGQRTTMQATNDITLDNPANDLGNVFVSMISNNNVTLVDVNAISLGSTAVLGALSVTAAGNITDQGALITVAGDTTLTAGAANDIALTALVSNFNTVTVVSANNVALTDVNAIVFDDISTISGNLTVTAGGTITDAAATTLSVAGLASFNASANAITLGDNAGDTTNFGSVSLTGTAVSVSEDSGATFVAISATTLSYTAAGAIDDGANGDVNVTDVAALTATANSITLGNDAGNNTNFGSISLSGSAVGVSEDSEATFDAITATTLNYSAAGAIDDGANGDVDATGAALFTATGNITLGNDAGNTTNFGSLTFNSPAAVSIAEDSDTVLSGSSTAQTLTLSSAGSITDAAGASVTVTNNSSTSAATAIALTDNASDVLSIGGNASFGGSSIAIAAPGTANFGSLTFNSTGAVGITEDSDTVLSGTSTAQTLTLNSAGSITDSPGARVTVTATSSMTAGAAISLTDNASDVLSIGGNASFGGSSIAIAAPGTANFGSLTFNSTGAVGIAEDSDTVLSGTSTAQTLTLNSAGSITDAAGASVTITNSSLMSAATSIALTDNATDVLIVGGNASFSGSSIAIAAPGTANFGSLTFNSTGPVGITEDSDTVLSGTSTAQTLTLSSAGSITDAAGASVTVTNNSSMSAAAISLTDNATDVLNVGGNASFSGSSIAVAAPGTANFGSLTFSSPGAVGITEDSDTVLSGTSTAQSLTLNSAGSITDAAGASVTVTANSSMTAAAPIALTDNATDVLNVGGNASFSGSSITVAAPGTANFGSLTFNSPGTVGITEDSSTSIVGASTASDGTVISAGDITVSGSINATGNIALRAAGNIAIQATAALAAGALAANTITLAVDDGNPNAAAKTIDIDNGATLTTNTSSATSGGVFLIGGNDNDTFIFRPRSTTRFVVTGNDPAFGSLLGDRLSIDLSPPAIAAGNATLTLGTVPGAGTFTFSAPETERPVEYTGIEDINAVGGQYHLVLDMVISGFQNGAADTINAAAAAGNINLAVNGTPFFTDDAASIRSASILGSSDVDQVNANAVSVLTSIDGRGASDILTIASTGAVTAASGGTGDDQLILLQASHPVTLQGNDGEDTFRLGNGTLASLTVVPNIVGGELGESTTRPVREGGIAAGTSPFFRPHLVAKSIADKLILNDQSATADAAFSIFGGSVNKNGANVATYSEIELLRLNAGSGNDDIAAFLNFGALPNIVQVDSGNDIFAENRFQVEGTAGADNISIGDLNDATEAVTPHRAAFELLNVKRAWVRGQEGNDTIDNISRAIGLFDGGAGDDFINFVSATPLTSKYNPGAKPKVAQNVSLVLGNAGKDFLFAGAGAGGNLLGSGGQNLGPYSDLGRVILMGDHGLAANNKLVAVNGGKGQKGDFYHFSSSASIHSFVAFGDNQANAVKGNNFIAPTFDKIKFSSTIAWLKVQLFVGAGQIRSIVNLLNTQVGPHIKAPGTPPKTPITSPLAVPLPAAPLSGEGESFLATNDRHNALQAGDVDGDGLVSPLDAVLIINDLNSRGGRKLASSAEGEAASLHFLDVDGDSFVSPLDAALVINALNAAPLDSADDELLDLLASDQAA